MGIILRSAMPLLSTLAALVIIVHSAEEDLESDFRRGIRPRLLNTESPSLELWRVEEKEPQMKMTPFTETWNDSSPEEQPKRRRPGRKRKRRPQQSEVIAETFEYHEEPRPYVDMMPDTNQQNSEILQRRRKKLDSVPAAASWSHETEHSHDAERPLRRRGQRRKRPLLDSTPKLSEFDGIIFSVPDESTVKPSSDEKGHLNDGPINELETDQNNEQDEGRNYKSEIDDFEMNNNKKNLKFVRKYKGDKVLSEFSYESLHQKSYDPELENVKEKLTEKTEPFDKEQVQRPIDPLTLKNILKRSNGTSLSEILQKHNLSLADLLHGKENAIAVLKSKESFVKHSEKLIDTNEDDTDRKQKQNDIKNVPESSEEQLVNSETKYEADPSTENLDNKQISPEVSKTEVIEISTTTTIPEQNSYKKVNIRRFNPTSPRRLRIRPTANFTRKGQFNKDIIAINSRRYLQNRKNSTKSQIWRNIIPSMLPINTSEDSNETTSSVPEEITIDNNTDEAVVLHSDHNNNDTFNNCTIEETTPSVNIKNDNQYNITEIALIPFVRQAQNASGSRRQAIHYRLKRKRLKQKSTKSELTHDDNGVKNLFGNTDLMPLSELIPKTQESASDLQEEKEFPTALEDFMVPVKPKSEVTTYRPTRLRSTTLIPPLLDTTTEDPAKFEIEEILNDTETSENLSRILLERNMTLNELVELRERGSSHVHLADIFHNKSKELHPPEPFLSKSIIEPISKETYPLRVLLDANQHEPLVKSTTINPNDEQSNHVNIPVVMEFGNNVNENAENMGIMSLFPNFTKSSTHSSTEEPEKEERQKSLQEDSEGNLYHTSITVVNATIVDTTTEMVRESRFLTNEDDVVSWKELFALMRKNRKNETKDPLQIFKEEVAKKIRLDEDTDSDGVIILEDLQHLKDFDSKISSVSDERLEVRTVDNPDDTLQTSGVLHKIPSQTKSITVVTASVAGLATVLFLLTYAVFKWKRQASMQNNQRDFTGERIPTPVFENRKGHKNNSSTRSISPMLSSNIYTLNTLDSRNGKESPEYMWDTLRKPFQ